MNWPLIPSSFFLKARWLLSKQHIYSRTSGYETVDMNLEMRRDGARKICGWTLSIPEMFSTLTTSHSCSLLWMHWTSTSRRCWKGNTCRWLLPCSNFIDLGIHAQFGNNRRYHLVEFQIKRPLSAWITKVTVPLSFSIPATRIPRKESSIEVSTSVFFFLFLLNGLLEIQSTTIRLVFRKHATKYVFKGCIFARSLWWWCISRLEHHTGWAETLINSFCQLEVISGVPKVNLPVSKKIWRGFSVQLCKTWIPDALQIEIYARFYSLWTRGPFLLS